MNEGVFSPWNGQRPFQLTPAFLRFTKRPTRSTMSTAARISSSNAGEYPAIYPIVPGEAISAHLERRHGSAGAALRRLAVPERLDQWMRGQERAHGLAERS